ncbi:MAG: ABC transporter permease [Porticoccaceae bacterium]
MSQTMELAPILLAIATGAVQRGTPIALAAIGEGMTERSGVMNLGVEGMMLAGALAGFAVQFYTGNVVLAILGAGLAGAMLACLHAIMVLLCNANQIVSGFALTILGTGLSGYFGRSFVGANIKGVRETAIPFLSRIPLVGDIFFRQDVFVYLAVVLTAVSWLIFKRSRFGLAVRAVGADPESAYAQGVRVRQTRFLAILIGGFLAGVGGAHLSVANTQVWTEKMTAGQGWIAVGLVIVARWRPVPTIIVAWAFGGMLVLHPYLQAFGSNLSSYIIGMMPYLAAAIALVIVTVFSRRSGQGMPAALARQLNLPE